MSRIGKKLIPIPKGVEVLVQENKVVVKGPKGPKEGLFENISEQIGLKIEDGQVLVTRSDDQPKTRSLHGLTRVLIANMVHGVSIGFTRKLDIEGVGYRAEVQGRELILNVGYSHPVHYTLPDGVEAAVEKNQITLSSIDKALLGQTAAKVREFRPPEPYKGKGIKYAEETVRRKVGKASVA